MTSPADDWSPADNSYAIAVSQSQLWRDIVRLTVLRMQDEDDPRAGWVSSRQLDAHVLVMTLRQLLTAEELEQVALEELGIEATVGDALTEARKRFEDALPGIKNMRNALMHFNEWSRGKGQGPQKNRVKAGEALRDIARDYWSFGYEPDAATVTFGPYTINIEVAQRAADELCESIYAAAHEVDRKNIFERRVRTIEVLEGAGISCNEPGASVRVSPGTDVRIWISLNITADFEEQELRELSERVLTALASDGLHLESTNFDEASTPVERLTRGEMFYVEPDV